MGISAFLYLLPGYRFSLPRYSHFWLLHFTLVSAQMSHQTGLSIYPYIHTLPLSCPRYSQSEIELEYITIHMDHIRISSQITMCRELPFIDSIMAFLFSQLLLEMNKFYFCISCEAIVNTYFTPWNTLNNKFFQNLEHGKVLFCLSRKLVFSFFKGDI